MLPPAFPNHSSSPSIAAVAADAPTWSSTGLPKGTVGAGAPWLALWGGTIPQLAQANKCTWNWDTAAYHVSGNCGVCPEAFARLCSIVCQGYCVLPCFQLLLQSPKLSNELHWLNWKEGSTSFRVSLMGSEF